MKFQPSLNQENKANICVMMMNYFEKQNNDQNV